ncbi:hypothetical protein CQZ88_01080 [Rhodococcus sp. ENV425]|nr:hypothetical protein CQZ88_01080 [Rhodococcus sp. ENV425]
MSKPLRTGLMARTSRLELPARTKRPWLEGSRVTDRPAEVKDCTAPAHWKAYVIVGPDNSAIVTLVER